MCPQGVSLSVRTDGSRSLEENMRQTLLACYTEFSEILKQMAITHVSNAPSHFSFGATERLRNVG